MENKTEENFLEKIIQNCLYFYDLSTGRHQNLTGSVTIEKRGLAETKMLVLKD